MSYVITQKIENQPSSFFMGWANKTRKEDVKRRPLWSSTLSDSRHWDDKTNCKRFINRNNDVFSKYELDIRKIQPVAFCLYCGAQLPGERRSQQKFCNDDEKYAFHNAKK